MDVLQETIHKLEVGGGMRHLRKGLVGLLLLALVLGYNWRGFRNMSTQEAMDSAQLARNLASGEGYSTKFVRPFSMYLLSQWKSPDSLRPGAFDFGTTAAQTQIKDRHPDLANAPVYPVVLAGLMKVRPLFDYTVSTNKPFWSDVGRFQRYEPDFLIGLFNQLLFFAAISLVYFLARRLFDPSVAFLSAILMLGTELFWRFSVSGLSTMLLLVIFLGVAWCLVLVEAETREPRGGPGRMLRLALLTGLLVGLGGLTRYAFGWLIVPVLLFIALYAGQRRLMLALLAFCAFAAVMTPWVARNYSVSGTPFGTAGYALYETTDNFPEYSLERSPNPDLSKTMFVAVQRKLTSNLRQIIQSDLPRLGGSWVGAFFLVGLLVIFRDPAITRFRYFMVACLVILAIAQALGRTQLSEDSPDINSENLLVLLAPLVLIYGVSLFYLLLEQVEFPFRELRRVAVIGFGLVICLPMLLAFLPPRTRPVAYPPYFPPILQQAASFARTDELTASDLPWALAWYGQRQCIWLNNPSDLIKVNDYQKPIQALLLTTLTIDKADSRSLFQAELKSDQTWQTLTLHSLPGLARVKYPISDPRNWPMEINLQVRPGAGTPVPFPLHNWQSSWPDAFLLTARDQPPKDL